MKTKEELNALKEEVETVSKKLHELTEEELTQVAGGYWEDCFDCKYYGHSRQCFDERQRGTCKHGYTR